MYDFIAADLDDAVSKLPESSVKGHANKYAALALKSRAMLYAASSAKYADVQLDGLVGIPNEFANDYWQVLPMMRLKKLLMLINILYTSRTLKSMRITLNCFWQQKVLKIFL